MSAVRPGRPGSRAAAFHDVQQDDGQPAEVVELRVRSRRLAQCDRDGLGAIDRALELRVTTLAEPPVLVGHSVGGLMTLGGARRHPVRPLLLLMPAPTTGLLTTVLGDAGRHPYNSIRMFGASGSGLSGNASASNPPTACTPAPCRPKCSLR